MSRGARRALVLAAVASAAATGVGMPAARAYFPERYLACEEPRSGAPSATASEAPAVGSPVPVARRRAPPVLRATPLTVIDVSVVEPPPTRTTLLPVAAVPAAPAPASGNDFRCIGAVRGKAAILHAISAPPGTRFFGHRKGHG
ncbi:MAG: hypothetical protein IT373_24830, partial [Polyangiaceae bacterium]|nr:hypothetical protein [Polyangiaceae bacterium]